MNNDRLYTELEIAEYLGVSAATVRSWRSRNSGPAYVKTGRSVRYRRQDVDQWVESKTITPETTSGSKHKE